MKKTKQSFQWNKVTSLSRYLAMVLFILLPFGGFMLGINYQKKIDLPSKQQVEAINPLENQIVTETPIKEWNIYISRDNKFSINYPKSWYMHQYDPGMVVEVRFGNTSDVLHLPNEKYYDLDLIYQEGEIPHLKNLKYSFGEKPFTIREYKGVISETDNDQGGVTTSIKLQNPIGGYVIITYSWQDPKILSQILSTFKFIDTNVSKCLGSNEQCKGKANGTSCSYGVWCDENGEVCGGQSCVAMGLGKCLKEKCELN